MAESEIAPYAAPRPNEISLSNPTIWSGQTASQGVTIAPLVKNSASNGFSLSTTEIQGTLNPWPNNAGDLEANSVYYATLKTLPTTSSAGVIGIVGYKTVPPLVPISAVYLLTINSGAIKSTDIFGNTGAFGNAVIAEIFKINNTDIELQTNANACFGNVANAQVIYQNGQFWLNLSGTAYTAANYKYFVAYSNALNAVIKYAQNASVIGLFYNNASPFTIFPNSIKGLTATSATAFKYNSLFAISGNVTLSSTGLVQIQDTQYDLLQSFNNVASWILSALSSSAANIPSTDYEKRITMLEKQCINMSTPQSMQYAEENP